MHEPINLPKLIDRLAAETGLPADDVRRFVAAMCETVEEALLAGESVTVKGVGEFAPGPDISHPVVFVPDSTLAAVANEPFAAFTAIELPDGITEDDLNGDEPAQPQEPAEELPPPYTEPEEPVEEATEVLPPPYIAPEEPEVEVEEETEKEVEEEPAAEIPDEPEVEEEPEECKPIPEAAETSPDIPELRDCYEIDDQLDMGDGRRLIVKQIIQRSATHKEYGVDVITPESDQKVIFLTASQINAMVAESWKMPQPPAQRRQPQVPPQEPKVVYVSQRGGHGLWLCLGLLAGIALGLAGGYMLGAGLIQLPSRTVECSIADTVRTEIVAVPAPVAVAAPDTVKPDTVASQPAPEPKAAPAPEPVYDTVSSTRYLTTMARDHYGKKSYWVFIYQANPQLRNPNAISPGTRVEIPPRSSFAEATDSATDAKAQRLLNELSKRYKL